MKRTVLIVLMWVGIIASASAQHDDLYFVPKKKKVEKETALTTSHQQGVSENTQAGVNTSTPIGGYSQGLGMDEDAYNRRWSYQTEDGNEIAEFGSADEGFVLITEDGDTMLMNTDTLRLTRVADDEGWVNGFDGSDSDYEYAMRIVRFRNPRYAIPVSSPLYWDVVYGGALWPSWDWNIYDDGMYAYVFPTSTNWYYWDYMASYPFGWTVWGHPWSPYRSCHWGYHWGGHYAWHHSHVWHSHWHNPYYHHYNYGWHHHHHHPGFGIGKPGWNVPRAYANQRTSMAASTRRGTQTTEGITRTTATVASRTGSTSTRVGSTQRTDDGSNRNTSVRVVTRNPGTVRSSSTSRNGSEQVVHRNSTSSSANRSTTDRSGSRSSYTRQSTSRSSNSGSSYNRPSSTRRSSSTVSRSSSSSSTSGSLRSSSSSYSGSSRSSGSSFSGSSRSSGSSFSGSSRSSGSSFSGGSRSSGSSFSGGSRSSGSRR